MGNLLSYLPKRRTNLQHLIQGKRWYSPPLALQHLSLADRYWQLRLQAYRHSLLTQSLWQVQKEHTEPLLEQIAKDTHPIFGAYILYLRALEFRLLFAYQEAADHIHFAIEWLECWRAPAYPMDLSQKVIFSSNANEDVP